MKTLTFSIIILAAPEKVWKSLIESENYKIWTTPFCQGSYYKTDNFAEGSRIHFLTPKGEGMYSTIHALHEKKYLAFKHIGDIKNFEEIPLSRETESWTGTMETYTLKEIATGTELTVQVEVLESFVDFMNTTFPLALKELKLISET